jgi:hypothetical protein
VTRAGVSITPVREALRLLEAQGYVAISDIKLKVSPSRSSLNWSRDASTEKSHISDGVLHGRQTLRWHRADVRPCPGKPTMEYPTFALGPGAGDGDADHAAFQRLVDRLRALRGPGRKLQRRHPRADRALRLRKLSRAIVPSTVSAPVTRRARRDGGSIPGAMLTPGQAARMPGKGQTTLTRAQGRETERDPSRRRLSD